MSTSFAFESASSPESLIDELEKFFVFWLGPRRPEYGESESSLESFPLPYPLRRLYAFAGRWPTVSEDRPNAPNAFSIQDSLRPFSTLERTEDGKVVFLDENQGVWTCATLPEGDDPPVWVEYGKGWVQVTESLSRFLVTFCLQELLFGSRFGIADDHLTGTFESLKYSVAKLWSSGPYVHGGEGWHFYLLHGTVLVGQLDDWVVFAANHEEGIRFRTHHNVKLVDRRENESNS